MGGLTFSIEDWGNVRIENLSEFFFYIFGFRSFIASE